MMSNKQPFSLEKCCEILNNRRKPLNSEQRQHIVGKYPYYGANGVQGYIDDYAFDDDLILIAEDGGYFDEFATRPIAYQVSGKCWVNNHAHVLKAKDDFSQDFIFYSLVHKDINKFIKGGTRAKLNLAELKAIEIEIPDLPTQKRIAKILSTVDGQIEKTAAIIAKYQAIKQGMLHDLFTRGIDLTTGKLRPIPEQAPELYKSSPLGLIPKDWDVDKLAKCCNSNGTYGINAAAVDYSNELPTYLRITDISENGKFINVDKKSVNHPLSSNYILSSGDIVFARTGASVGKTYLYNQDDGELIYAGFLIKFSPNIEKILPKFLKLITELSYYQNWVTKASMRSGQPGINGQEYGGFEIQLPHIEEQALICTKIDSLENLYNSESKKLTKLQKIKHGLMSKLLNGVI